jgi:hypothetical protein
MALSHERTRVRVCTRASACVCATVRACARQCACVCAPVCVHTCLCAHALVCVRARVCACVCVCMCVRARARVCVWSWKSGAHALLHTVRHELACAERAVEHRLQRCDVTSTPIRSRTVRAILPLPLRDRTSVCKSGQPKRHLPSCMVHAADDMQRATCGARIIILKRAGATAKYTPDQTQAIAHCSMRPPTQKDARTRRVGLEEKGHEITCVGSIASQRKSSWSTSPRSCPNSYTDTKQQTPRGHAAITCHSESTALARLGSLPSADGRTANPSR